MRIARLVFILIAWSALALAQEASSGFELGTTLSGMAAYAPKLTESPRDGAPVTAGARLMLYPTLKLSDHWSISGAVQISTRPYFYESFYTQGYGVKTDIIQLNLSYARVWTNRSLVVRIGQLSTAFGSFPLRYDDAKNPLIDVPLSYGYYGQGVTLDGLAGAQVDATAGKLDARAQFVNSSPANRRSIFDHDQYGNWAGGVGYTIRQGFRVGISAYRGPYLDRQSPFFFPGEANPKNLPGSAYGADVQWGHGPWSASGEIQRFQFIYRAIPDYNENIGYAELRRVLHPRWYVATRVGYQNSVYSKIQVYENVVGYRPNRFQLIKVGYEIQHGTGISGTGDNVLGIQLVTSFTPISIGHN